jgi:ribosomal protein S27AE
MAQKTNGYRSEMKDPELPPVVPNRTCPRCGKEKFGKVIEVRRFETYAPIEKGRYTCPDCHYEEIRT